MFSHVFDHDGKRRARRAQKQRKRGSHSRHLRPSQLRVEPLEDRRLLAVDITALPCRARAMARAILDNPSEPKIDPGIEKDIRKDFNIFL